jgi:hypothetical protein
MAIDLECLTTNARDAAAYEYNVRKSVLRAARTKPNTVPVPRPGPGSTPNSHPLKPRPFQHEVGSRLWSSGMSHASGTLFDIETPWGCLVPIGYVARVRVHGP